MSQDESKEYEILIDKRQAGELTNKEYKRYLFLLNKAFAEGIPKIVKAWTESFHLT